LRNVNVSMAACPGRKRAGIDALQERDSDIDTVAAPPIPGKTPDTSNAAVASA
jgi:hypothetical protein